MFVIAIYGSKDRESRPRPSGAVQCLAVVYGHGLWSHKLQNVVITAMKACIQERWSHQDCAQDSHHFYAQYSVKYLKSTRGWPSVRSDRFCLSQPCAISSLTRPCKAPTCNCLEDLFQCNLFDSCTCHNGDNRRSTSFNGSVWRVSNLFRTSSSAWQPISNHPSPENPWSALSAGL